MPRDLILKERLQRKGRSQEAIFSKWEEDISQISTKAANKRRILIYN